MKGNHVELVIDIGSASIGACFASYRENEKPKLAHINRISLLGESGGAQAAIEQLALEALKKLLQNMPHSPAPEKIHVVFAAPWYNASTESIRAESEKPLRITEATIAHTLLKHRRETAGKKNPERQTLESVVTRVYVNGYPSAVASPLRGNTLVAELYESEADVSFVQSVERVIQNVFPHAPAKLHTFSFLAFSVLRALYDTENFVFIDIGGEITEVVVATRGSLNFIGSFPQGSLSLVRAVAGAGSMADALSRMTLFAKGELSTEEKTSFARTFGNASSPWKTQFATCIGQAGASTPIPRAVFTVADKDALLWFQKIFSSSEDVFPLTPTLVTPNFFQDAVTLGDEASYDAFLSMGAIFSWMERRGLVKS